MVIKQEILEKAKKLLVERNKQIDYEETCREARICPICGEPMITYHEYRRNYWFFYKDEYLVRKCPEGHHQWETSC